MTVRRSAFLALVALSSCSGGPPPVRDPLDPGMWFEQWEKTKRGKDLPVIRCEDVPRSPTPEIGRYARVRVPRIATAEGACGHLLIGLSSNDFLPLVNKSLARLGGCESCSVLHVEWIALRDIVLAIKYWRWPHRRPDRWTEASLDMRRPPGREGGFVIEYAAFRYIEGPSRDARLGALEQRCGASDRFAAECGMRFDRFASEAAFRDHWLDYHATWPSEQR